MELILLEICGVLLLSGTNVTAAEFINCLTSQQLEEGQRDTILCQAVGNELQTLQWLKDGEVIHSGHRYIIQTDGLTITDVIASDEGVYTAIHPDGFSSVNITVDVVAPVSFDSLDETIIFRQHSDAIVECSARGRPPPTYTWLDPNRDLSSTAGPWSVDKEMGTLRFPRIQMEHDGSYTCVASNGINILSKVFTLVVTAGSVPGKIESVTLVEVTDTSATFDILPSQDDPDTDITHYLVLFGAISRGNLELATNISIPAQQNNRYVVKDLMPGRIYSFQFAAANDEGIGPMSDEIRVPLLPPPPLLMVDTKESGPGSFTIKWNMPLEWENKVTEYEFVYYQMAYESGVMILGNCPVKVQILSCHSQSYTVHGVSTYIPVYQIFVSARNEAGFGRNSSIFVSV